MLSVGIIGLGRIGSGFDQPEGPAVFTHLKACLSDKRFRVTMLTDAEPGRARREAERFNVDAKVANADEFLGTRFDAVAIATPEETHLPFAARALEAGSRAIVIEKPVGGNRSQRHDLLVRSKSRNALVVVNYPRRFLPRLAGWLKSARDGEFGRPISARIRYGRGFRHNAIHGLDLVAACMPGDVRCAYRVGSAFEDYSPADPTISLAAELMVGRFLVPLFIEGIDGHCQTVFEADLAFEHARALVVDENGIRARFFAPASIGGGFAAELRQTGEVTDEPPCLMLKLWEGVGDALLQGQTMSVGGPAAFVADDFVDELLAATDRPAR